MSRPHELWGNTGINPKKRKRGETGCHVRKEKNQGEERKIGFGSLSPRQGEKKDLHEKGMRKLHQLGAPE